MALTMYPGVVAQIPRDSSRESSMLAVQHEQTSEDYMQDDQLEELQSGAEASRFADRMVRSLYAAGGDAVRAARTPAVL